MPLDNYVERLARAETLLGTLATKPDLVRLEERVIALGEVTAKFIELKSYHNEILETRVRKVEESVATMNVKLAPITEIETRMGKLESAVSNIDVKLAIIRVIAIASLGGVVTLIVSMIIRAWGA